MDILGRAPTPVHVDNTAWLIPLLPIAGFLFQVVFGRRLPKPVVGFVSCGVVAVSALLAWKFFFTLMGLPEHDRVIVAPLGRWISIPGGDQGWLSVVAAHKLLIDPLTAVMILVVTNIGFFIHLYSTGYMAEEKRYSRYFAYLNLFTGFMLILVMASNLILMFVGWEGVGLCSYLLIGFWYEKKENASAGMKAFIVNRVGDLSFTIGALTLFVYLGTTFGVWTVDFQELKHVVGQNKEAFSVGVATFIGICLFGGATGKSAQLPLYTWLPDAMAGPTPVSALIHAATMVTAGVYMIARMNFLYALAPYALAVVAIVGTVTALFAGTIGMAQNDIKKVLAYSTVSQLGFMFMGVGVGAYAAGIFHLFTHAFFKACLFLGSGSVIHGMGGEQDIRRMGGLKDKMPWTYATFAIASLAIAGIPPLAGFFSKDEILWSALTTHSFDGTLFAGWLGKALWLVGITAAACTAFYMTRLVIKTFRGKANWGHAPEAASHAPASARADEPGGGMDLPDWMKEEHKPAPHHEDAQPLARTEDDESLLDLGKMGRAVRAAADAHGHDAGLPAVASAEAGHHGEPHECPWSMRSALVFLAAGSVVVGLLGIPHVNLFAHWLEPVTGKHEAGGKFAIELLFMLISTLVAAGGIFLAWRVYFRQEGRPAEEFTRRNPELYDLVLNKYKVDELYDDVVVQPLLAANEKACVFDNEIVDGAVNLSARAGARASNAAGYFDNEVVDGALNAGAGATLALGGKVRRLQTGNIRQYLTVALVGGLGVFALFCAYLARENISGILKGLFGSQQ